MFQTTIKQPMKNTKSHNAIDGNNTSLSRKEDKKAQKMALKMARQNKQISLSL